MSRPRLAPLVALAAAVAFAPGAAGQAPPDGPRTVRLLNVGNSFSQNATRYLGEVAKSRGDVLIHHQAAIPGGTLRQHCEKAEAHDADPDDPAGLYAGTKRSLAWELAAEPWDYITIQQASLFSHDVATYRPYAERLVDRIRRGAPGAQIVVHETWAYRVDDPRFGPSDERPPGEPADREAMHRGLAAAYRTIARELDAPIVPVGDAFHIADTDPTWGYRPDAGFDLAAAAYPTLPDQTHSLHTGRRWVKQADGSFRMAMDGHHANVAGQYLGALVFYESLFGRPAVGCPYRPNGINAEYAKFLQEAAHRAVADLKGTEFEIKAKAAAAR
jgi:hypothetical protein